MVKYWICNGEAKDKQNYFNQKPPGLHKPYENRGSHCLMCNLTKEQVIGEESKLTIKSFTITAGSTFLVAAVFWAFLRSCPSGLIKTYGVMCRSSEIVSPEPPNPGLDRSTSNQELPIRENLYSWEPERFSWGNRTLFPGTGNTLRDKGIEHFNAGDYEAAIRSFKRAIQGDINDPEALIFYNNSLARQKGKPFTLAVVVPVYNRENSAKEILRGVAMAQAQFNAAGGLNGKLLEIIIANDGNVSDDAIKVAKELCLDASILGVIGHNSSSATVASLSIYEQAKVAVISATSTSTEINSDVFFRTLPSDAIAGEKLAQHAKNKLNLNKAAIFFNPEDSFSRSLQTEFQTQFEKLGGKTVLIETNYAGFNAGVSVATAVYEEQADAGLLFPGTAYSSVAIEIAKANSELTKTRKLKLLGGDSLYSMDTLTAGGESVEGLILAVPWSAESPKSKRFLLAGLKQWEAPVNWRTAMSFDATQAFINSLTQDPSRAQVLVNLKQTKLSESETSGELIEFTIEGERGGEPVLVEIVRGSVNKVPNSEYGYEIIQ